MHQDYYTKLIESLDRFIRRYYLNKLVRGCLVLLIGIAAIVLILSLSEYFLFLRSWLKISILSLVAFIVFYALVFGVLRPLLHMQRIGKLISREQAAIIIGRFFPEIKDKLGNILQLKQDIYSGESEELALESIEQKSKQLSGFKFVNAVDLKKNRDFVKWLLPLVVILGTIGFFWPQVFKDAAFRFSKPTVSFYPPAPFQFILKNSKLLAPANGDYQINVKVQGEKLPETVQLVVNGQALTMDKATGGNYSYTIHNVSLNVLFYFQAAGFRSAGFELQVVRRPQLDKITLGLQFPAYTGLKAQQLEGFSIISVPEGTRLSWQLQTKSTRRIRLRFSGNKQVMLPHSNAGASWTYTMLAKQDSLLTFFLSGDKLPDFDSLSYSLQVIPDNPPSVTAAVDKDSISGRKILVTGMASDDYGISRLNFHYTILDPSHKIIEDKVVPVQAARSQKRINYNYYFDLNEFHLLPGQIMNYYFEAWDNDAIHGSKKGISEIFSYYQNTKKQLEQAIQENNLAINQQISNSTKAVDHINQDVEKFREQMLQSPGMSWEQQNQLKSLTERQESLQDKVNALKRRFDQQQRQSQERQYSEQIKEKQQELARQLDKVQNKDLAEMMKKLQEMLRQKNKDHTFEQLKQWQEQNKLFQMDMERIQALMKQLALQMKMEDLAQKAKDLAAAQRRLAEKSMTNSDSKKNVDQPQKDLAKQLDDLMTKDFSELEKANRETENPQDLSVPKQEGQQAQQQMQNSLNQNNSSQSGKQQQNAAQNLEQMSAALMKMAGGMDMKMVDINIKATRQLLTNLIRYSFAQEDLIKSEKPVPVNAKVFNQHLQTQQVLKQNTEMIKDSLFSLSKRIFQLAPSINKETSELTGNIDQALSLLENRRVMDARVSQQFAMANANNLALMLDETLRHLMQMQMQAKGQQGGKGMPSSGQSGQKGQGSSAGQMMKDIITGQQQMGKGLSQMQGQSPDGSASGNKAGRQGQNGNSSENGGSGEKQAEMLARLAQQQAEIRNMMQELSSMLNSEGNGKNAALIKEIQKSMNQNETDLVNRRLQPDLFKRQQAIMTRLLKAQDAIRNQEQDNKRLAETAGDTAPAMPPELKEVLEKRKTFLESYQTIPANLSPFYRQMTEKYQKEIGGK